MKRPLIALALVLSIQVVADGNIFTQVFNRLMGKKATLTLLKVVQGGTSPISDWRLTATGPSTLSGTSGVNATVQIGTYTLSETGPGGYVGSWSCPGVTVGSGNQIRLENKQNIACTVTNRQCPPLEILEKTLPDGVVGQPYFVQLHVTGGCP